MKKIIISKELCAEFNKFRADNFMVYTYNQILDIFKNFGFKGPKYVSAAVKLGVLTKAERGKYRFSKEPVHISKLQAIRDTASKKPIKKVPSALSEETATAFLKKLGYKVSKPQIDVETALKCPDSPIRNFIKWVTL